MPMHCPWGGAEWAKHCNAQEFPSIPALKLKNAAMLKQQMVIVLHLTNMIGMMTQMTMMNSDDAGGDCSEDVKTFVPTSPATPITNSPVATQINIIEHPQAQTRIP